MRRMRSWTGTSRLGDLREGVESASELLRLPEAAACVDLDGVSSSWSCMTLIPVFTVVDFCCC